MTDVEQSLNPSSTVTFCPACVEEEREEDRQYSEPDYYLCMSCGYSCAENHGSWGCPKCTAIMEEGILLNMEYIKTKRFKRLKKMYLKEDDKLQKKWEKFIEKGKKN